MLTASELKSWAKSHIPKNIYLYGREVFKTLVTMFLLVRKGHRPLLGDRVFQKN